MVFEKLTLFEIEIEGEQIGPRSLGRSERSEPVDVDRADATDSRAKPMLVLVLMAAALAFAWRRYRTPEEDVDLETEPDEADLATAQ